MTDVLSPYPESISTEKRLAEYLRKRNFDNNRFYVQYRPDFERLKMKPLNISEVQESWVHNMEVNNLADLNRLYFIGTNLAQTLERCNSGAIAELGVFQGNSAKVFNSLAPDRTLYLFDTFEGLPEDDLLDDGLSLDSPRFSCDLKSVQNFLGDSKNIVYCEGRFPGSTDRVEKDTKFAFVHLDCDLYTPTKEGLQYFYPSTLPGGMIVVHDYLSGYWPGVKKAVDEFFVDKPEYIVHIPDKSGTVAVVKQ